MGLSDKGLTPLIYKEILKIKIRRIAAKRKKKTKGTKNRHFRKRQACEQQIKVRQ